MLKHLITRLEFYLIKIEDGFTCRATLVIEKLKIWKEFPSKMTWIIYDRMDEFNIIVVLCLGKVNVWKIKWTNISRNGWENPIISFSVTRKCCID